MDGTCLPNTIRLQKLSCPQKGRHSSPSTFAWRGSREIPPARAWRHLPGNKDPGLPQPRRRPVIEFPNYITPLANVRSMCWGTLPPPSPVPPVPARLPPRGPHGGPPPCLDGRRARPARLRSPPPAPGAGSGQGVRGGRGGGGHDTRALPQSLCTSSNIDQV